MPTIGHFIAGIAALIYHPPSQTYLLLRRATDKDAGAGEWECVTGRVDQGESFEQALIREVREEIGVTVALDFIIGTTHFYRGAPVPENELVGVKYACSIAERDSITISAEHSEQRWLTADEVYALLAPDHWLYRTIQRAEILRTALPQTIIDLHRREGFE
ncbi:MAG: NUDIX domain-containing protein [bacterium]|nr:NUDIX domain-containing protein [bacterium]